jgi:hypothetical protein
VPRRRPQKEAPPHRRPDPSAKNCNAATDGSQDKETRMQSNEVQPRTRLGWVLALTSTAYFMVVCSTRSS